MTSAASHLKHMCRELPEEILVSNVLPRLPLASLCRFRAVCKKWNALPTQSDFAARHALASPIEEFVLMQSEQWSVLMKLMELMQPANSLGDWKVLDVTNSRVFSLSYNFLATLARCGSIIGEERKILAADGGLLFVWYGNRQDHSLIVCNPILKAVKVIPSLEVLGPFHTVVMSTDTVSMRYMILVFHRMEDHYQTNCMDVFESKTGKWRSVVNTSVPSPERWHMISGLVNLKNALYQLYVNEGKPYLIKFDKTTGVGSKLNFVEPVFGDGDEDSHSSTLELVVSQGRLFCVHRFASKGQNKEHEYLEILKVFLEQHECQSLVRMPTALLHWLVQYDLNPKPGWGGIDFGHFDSTIGCASSILFTSGVGRFVAYDMVNRSWHQFSHSPPSVPTQYHQCSNFGLSLCPP